MAVIRRDMANGLRYKKERIYRDRIFVTDQDIDQLNDNDHYNINKDQYTTNNSYDNEYIVI